MSTARDQLLADLFVTALEGGIQYWAEVVEYRWMQHGASPDDPVELAQDRRDFYAVIGYTKDDADEMIRIDRSVMARGYRLATGLGYEWRTRLAWSTEPPPLVVTDDTDWDFDAGDADMIVQLGLFGDVVYG